MKKMKLIIDADNLIFECTEGKFTKSGAFGSESGEVKGKGKKYKEPLKQYKQKFKRLVKDIEDEIAVALLGRVKLKGKPKISLSDPNGNFRYDLLPTYKSSRKGTKRSELFYRLRDWATEKYGYVENMESDDVCGYYMIHRDDYICATIDKDIYRGTNGLHFNSHFTKREIVETSPKQARDFNLIQTIMGDPVDDIKALPKDPKYDMIPIDPLPEGLKRQPFKITEKIAIELLDKYGWDYDGVLKIFKSRGFGKKEMTLNRRLVGLDQWHPKEGLKLWKMK